jgi:hypothetical protein
MEGNNILKRRDVAYFTFGRFQPPTIGHGFLIKTIGSMAAKDGADAYIFVSQKLNKLRAFKEPFVSTKDNENPLDVYNKVEVLKKMYPDSGVSFINSLVKNSIDPLKSAALLLASGYKKIVIVVGSDRLVSFTKLFSKMPELTVQSIGDRGGRNNGTAKTMSGTKMRTAAALGNLNTFKKGVLTEHFSDANAEKLYRNVRAGLGIRGGRYTRRLPRLQD